MTGVPADVRGAGFGGRAPLAAALAWIEAHAAALPAETIPAHEAAGRVLAVPPTGGAWPLADRALHDGYAVCAAETEGAGDYNPLPLITAAAVNSGDALPPGTDAVAPYASVSRRGPGYDALAPVPRGAAVERRGSEAAVLPTGPLRPDAVALLALLDVAQVEAVRRPRVALVVAGAKSGPDVLTGLLRSLVARDGGTAAAHAGIAAVREADLLLLAGRSGCGWDDDMPHRLAAAGGALDLHGIAFRPGDSAGLGRLGAVPVVLLPGSPLAALSAYEVLAGPAVRRMGARADLLPWVERQAVLARKVTSLIGCTDMVRVTVAGGRAMPLGPADAAGLGRAVMADGWVIVPDESEGYPAGARVTVRCRTW